MPKKKRSTSGKKIIILDRLVELNELAMDAILAGNFDKAKRLLMAAKKEIDIYPPTNNNLAYVYFLEGNNKKAFKLAKEVLSIIPEHVYTHILLAKIYTMQKNMREAQKHIDTAIDEFFKDIENAIYIDTIIDTLALAGDSSRIIHFWERLQDEIDFETLDAPRNLLYTNIVIAYYNTRNFEKLNKLIQTFLDNLDNSESADILPLTQAYILFAKALLENKIYDYKFAYFSQTLELMFEHNKAVYKRYIRQLKDQLLAILFLPFNVHKELIHAAIMDLLPLIHSGGYNSTIYKKVFEVIGMTEKFI